MMSFNWQNMLIFEVYAPAAGRVHIFGNNPNESKFCSGRN
jgi:hypothetical protein